MDDEQPSNVVVGEGGMYNRQLGDESSDDTVRCVEGRDVHASLLQRLSLAFPDFSSAMPRLDRFEFPSNAGSYIILCMPEPFFFLWIDFT